MAVLPEALELSVGSEIQDPSTNGVVKENARSGFGPREPTQFVWVCYRNSSAC